MSTIDEHIAGQMVLARRLSGLTQKDLAKDIGVTYQQVSKREKAQDRISAADLYRTAKALCVPVTYFFEGYEDE